MKNKKKVILSISIATMLMATAGLFSACSGCNGNQNLSSSSGIVNESDDTIKLEVGDSWQFSFSGVHYEYSFTSDNEAVAKISNTGLVKAVGVGEATLYIKVGEEIFASQKVSVKENNYIPPQQVVAEDIYRFSNDQSEYNLLVGKKKTLEISLYKNGSISTDTITYTIADETVAQIETTDNGVNLIGKKVGATNLKVSIGKFSANYAIYVFNGTKYLQTPEIINFTSSSIQWTPIDNASGYKISFDGGISYQTTDSSSFAITNTFNPFDLRIYAYDNSGVYINSDKFEFNPYTDASISKSNAVVLCMPKTIAGNDNTFNKQKELNIELVYGDGAEDVYRFSQGVKWSIDDPSIAELNGNVIASKSEGSTTVKAEAFGYVFNGEVNVGTPISGVADLNALALAAKNAQSELWANGKYYVLTNDIVFSKNADYSARYLMPIAAYITEDLYINDEQWGIYGALNPENLTFNGTIDGQGYSIKNAVIPYGTGLSASMHCTVGNNFIGYLGEGGALRNIAFDNLIFEAYDKIDTYMYSTANNPMLASNIDITALVGENGGDWSKCNNAFRTGLVGVMENAAVENVYVDTVVTHNTRNNGNNSSPTACGVLVGNIKSDNAKSNYGESKVVDCKVRVAFDKNYTVGRRIHIYGQGFGALIGASYTGKNSTVQNCFVDTYQKDNLVAVMPGELYSRAVKAGYAAYSNCYLNQNIVTEFTSFENDMLSWQAVSDASGYRLSLDGGDTFIDVNDTSYDLSGIEYNPLDIRLAVSPYSNTKYIGGLEFNIAKGSVVNWAANEAAVSYRLSTDGVLYNVKLSKDTTTYTLDRDLLSSKISVIIDKREAVTHIFDSATKTVSWKARNVALEYYISTDGGQTYTALNNSTLSYEVGDSVTAGDIKVEVVYVGGYASLNLATGSKLFWNNVSGATGYKLTFDGVSYSNIANNFYLFDSEKALKNIGVLAFSDETYNTIGLGNLLSTLISADQAFVLLDDKSLSGEDNICKTEMALPSLQLNIGNAEINMPVEQTSWTSLNESIVIVEDGKLKAVNEGQAYVNVTYGDISFDVLVRVGKAIKSNADLNVLALAAKNGNSQLWSADKYYMLTNDITFDANAAYHERYVMPIAAYITVGDDYTTEETWGIYGNLNPENISFNGTIDGQGYSIKNAVIPYGTGYVPNMNCTTGNNFIGYMGEGGVLKNIAFENLIFEEFDKIDTYLYSKANNSMLAADIDIVAIVGENGGENQYWIDCNNAFRAGLVGVMRHATIENVYVETVMSNNTPREGGVNNPVGCGVLVGNILNDVENGSGKVSSVKNCVVKAVISTEYMTSGYTNKAYGGGMGAVVGCNYTQKASTISNCYVITMAETTTTDMPVGENYFYSKIQRDDTTYGVYTDCVVYSNAELFEEAQSDKRDVITIYNWRN